MQQFFTKLGARYVVITDADGHCECQSCISYILVWRSDHCALCVLDEGVIDKKTWLAFLDELEHKSD